MKDNVAMNMIHVSNTGRYDVEVRIPATYCRGLGFKFCPGYNLCDFHVLSCDTSFFKRSMINMGIRIRCVLK